MMARGLAAALVAVGLLAGTASIAAAQPATRFEGTKALEEAARFINRSIGYEFAYDPGRLAILYVPAYQGLTATIVRFSPSDGHQVLFAKGYTKARPDRGGVCAEFQIIIEKFTSDSLEALERDRSGVTMRVAAMDRVAGEICWRDREDMTVGLAGAQRNEPRNAAEAFSYPFAFGASDGGI
jgi:hypothetical protein